MATGSSYHCPKLDFNAKEGTFSGLMESLS